eukprot:3321490-Lingulodinium_polyedra.AAC.1
MSSSESGVTKSHVPATGPAELWSRVLSLGGALCSSARRTLSWTTVVSLPRRPGTARGRSHTDVANGAGEGVEAGAASPTPVTVAPT